MKTLNIMIAVCALAFSLRANATTHSPESGIISNVIKASITYPEEARSQLIEGSAAILFSIDTEGKIIILDISATEAVFSESIKNDIQNINCRFMGFDPNESFLIRIRFKLE